MLLLLTKWTQSKKSVSHSDMQEEPVFSVDVWERGTWNELKR